MIFDVGTGNIMADNNTGIRDRMASWERLRLVYNLVMLGVGVAVAMRIHAIVQSLPMACHSTIKMNYDPGGIVRASILFAVMANILYFLGPIAETYIVSFTSWDFRRVHRYLVFAVGLLFSMGVQLCVYMYFGLLQQTI
jgi:hypothetical protein